jgi:hypothetical protein
MEVELLIRWIKPKSQERQKLEEERNLFENKYGIYPKEVLEPENYDDVFFYEPMTFKVEDVSRFNKVDGEHTTITFSDGLKYVAKIPYQTFQAVYEGLTMRRVMIVNNNRLQELQKDY